MNGQSGPFTPYEIAGPTHDRGRDRVLPGRGATTEQPLLGVRCPGQGRRLHPERGVPRSPQAHAPGAPDRRVVDIGGQALQGPNGVAPMQVHQGVERRCPTGGAAGEPRGISRQDSSEVRPLGPTLVVATDFSPAILRYAAEAAVTTVQTMEVDGENLDGLTTGSFDAVISRVGLIYLPDQHRALSGMRQALRPGGRVSAIVYSTPDRNEFFSVPVSIIRARAQLPAPQPGQPGPFSLGGPGVLESALVRAGFSDVTVQAVPAPLRLASAAECVRFERESFGALHQMLSGLPAEQRPAIWEEVESALTRFETPSGFFGPCELLVGSGSR